MKIAVADHHANLWAKTTARRWFSSVRAAIKQRSNMWVDVCEVPRAEFQGFAYKARRWADERQDGYRL